MRYVWVGYPACIPLCKCIDGCRKIKKKNTLEYELEPFDK